MSVRPKSVGVRSVVLAVGLVAVLLGLSGRATAAAAVPTVTSYPIPAPAGVQTVTPYAVTAARDGRMWFVAGMGNGAFVGRMTTGGTVGSGDEIVLPHASGSQLVDLVGITVGPDSDLWATHDVGYVAHVPIAAARTSDVTDYTDFARAPGKIVAGPDSRLWFATPGTENGAITTTGTFSFYPTTSTTNAQGIAVGSDGNLWYGEAGAIGVMTPGGARVHDYPLPAGWFAVSLVKAPDGNVWGTMRASFGNPTGAIAKITPAGVVTIFRTPQVGQPYGIAVGHDGQLWFTDRSADQIGTIPTTAASSDDITEYPLPAGTAPLGIAAGPDGRMWFAESGTGKLGAIQPPLGPTAATADASSVTQTTATLNGTVNPNGSQITDCHFDYGTTTSYGSSVPCSTSPGTGTTPVAVLAPISGLAPGTTYNFRLVATSAEGTSNGNNRTVTTTPPAGQPTSLSTYQFYTNDVLGHSITVPAGATTELDRAQVNGSNFPSGTVTFNLYSNPQCTGHPVFSSTNPVSTSNLSVVSDVRSDVVGRRLTPGTYYWTAAYSGDVNNLPSASSCGNDVLTVQPVRILPGAVLSPQTVTLTMTCVVLPCQARVTVTSILALRASDAPRKAKRKPSAITLAHGAVTIKKHGAQTVRLRLTPAGRRFVAAHKGHVTVNVAVVMTIAGHTRVANQHLKVEIIKPNKSQQH